MTEAHELDIPFGIFRFPSADRVAFGKGSVRRLGQELDRAGCQRALVLTGQSIATNTDLLWYVEQILGPRHAATYTGVRQHVPASTVAEAADLAHEAGADCLISLGGGSPIDTAKAVAYRLAFGADERDAADAAKERAARPTLLPHFAIPTTLSAAEFTHVGGVTDETTRIKRGVAEPRLMPRTVFLDPEMTLPTPMLLWLSTGIKALDHAIERFLSPEHQPLTDALALEAVRLLFANLERTRDAPHDLTARLYCQIAAWMSIFGAADVRTGLSHALGHQIGARCDVPHGITSCITLAPVLRFVGPAIPERMGALGRAMGLASLPTHPEALAETVAERGEMLVEALGLPTRLRETGIARAELSAIASATFPEVAARRQPRAIAGVEDLQALLDQMW